MDIQETKNYLKQELGSKWSIKSFWEKIDLRFFNGSEGYTLNWIKEVNFDLDRVGKDI
jgi:hypothetical protein